MASSTKFEGAVKCVLLDIEGTTTPITFVHDVLFPYARNHLREYLDGHFDLADAAIQGLFARSSDLLGDSDEGLDEKESIIKIVGKLMDRDEKFGPLKELQGRIWQLGYDSGVLFGSVYPDVLPCIRKWRENGLKVCIYSSGSVPAQKLLFGHIEPSQLHPNEQVLDYFNGFFDTAVGSKVESPSYLNIAQQLLLDPSDILFLTDRVLEAQAAREAKIKAVLLDRPGNAPLTDADRDPFMVITSFEQLDLKVNA